MAKCGPCANNHHENNRKKHKFGSDEHKELLKNRPETTSSSKSERSICKQIDKGDYAPAARGIQ
jgi:hypothetical protein